MLKIRIIPVLLLKNNRMVKPINFGEKGERDVGFPVTTARIYDSQGADELVFLDITATEDGRNFLLDTLSGVARDCFVPLTVGGGIRSIEAINDLLSSGADKVAINTYAVENPSFITEAANKFGGQCIVVSIDVKKNDRGIYEVFINQGKKATGLDAVEWAKKVEKLGAGEILLTSIDREGMMVGYDLDLIKIISEAVSIPVIANGGAGTRQHFADAIKIANASAVAASSIFHFSDSNLSQVKSFLNNSGISVRPI
ncbi:MAG: glycosyl amidation-associated protein WbuZ [Patescibacteria group bacterium]